MTEIQILKHLNLLCECNVHERATGRFFSGRPYPGYNISQTELVTHVLYKISHQNMWFSTFNGLKNIFHTIFSNKRQLVACARHIRCLVLPVWMSFRFFRGAPSRSIKKNHRICFFQDRSVVFLSFFLSFWFFKKNVGSGRILGSVGLHQYNNFWGGLMELKRRHEKGDFKAAHTHTHFQVGTPPPH